MLCGGNTVIMCGTCDMGRKGFFCRTHFFSYPPPPLGGVTPEKKYLTRYQNFFSSTPPVLSPLQVRFVEHQKQTPISRRWNLLRSAERKEAQLSTSSHDFQQLAVFALCRALRCLNNRS